MIETITSTFNILNLEILLSILALCAYLIIILGLQKIINRQAIKQHLSKSRRVKIIRLSKFFVGIGTLFFLFLVWGLNVKDIWVFSSVVLGFIGVSVFAVWSLLSNVLAGYILFFSQPFQIGDIIVIKEGSDPIKGEVNDMTTFYVKIKLEDNTIAIIPNNLIFQKTIIKYKT